MIGVLIIKRVKILYYKIIWRTVHVWWNVRTHWLAHIPVVHGRKSHAARTHGFVEPLSAARITRILLTLDVDKTSSRLPVGRSVDRDFLHVWRVQSVQNAPHILVHFQSFKLCRFAGQRITVNLFRGILTSKMSLLIEYRTNKCKNLSKQRSC